ncbi:MAG: response regulator transcription factor [Bacteroidetes bacterium]|nr:response regulator transcription factor [Bacteroidota bacterium]
MKLVIADDSSLMRERIKSQVSSFDQVTIVGEAGNGRTAMEMVIEFDPDLILLDLHMPEMGGMEVLKKIKEAKLNTKVCILTNYSYPQYKERCLALGADFFLSKSDDFEKTNVVISNMLIGINP